MDEHYQNVHKDDKYETKPTQITTQRLK